MWFQECLSFKILVKHCRVFVINESKCVLSTDPNQQQVYYGGQPQQGYPQQQGYHPSSQQQQQAYYPPPQQQQVNSPPQQPAYMDPEDPEAKGFEFNDQSIRKGFIRKVFAILTVSNNALTDR